VSAFTERTEGQSPDERRQAIELSLRRTRPPGHAPGFEPLEFLGAGAYGEVWVAIDRNTGRRVAIKFYAHQGGLDWSLLAREVEKLRFLFADRYVVQLIEVGWEAEPPYYVMEYVEHGSLAKRLSEVGKLPVREAVQLFREVAIGLVHAHGKGVLHCDLKPANVLLDQDGRPRLADFGQARLSHEQTPSLGTLFYMAPEQADLQAAPDARWDVYALGALLYTMLLGEPPHRSPVNVAELEQPSGLAHRLERYRELLRAAPPLEAHRKAAGVDRSLAEILERCLAIDPARRYPNVQAVLDALQARDDKRSRQPLILLGAFGPLMLMGVMAFFAWRGFDEAYRLANKELTAKALDSKQYYAKFVAYAAAHELERRFELVENTASSSEFRQKLAPLIDDDKLLPTLLRLSDPVFAAEDAQLSPELRAEREVLRQELLDNQARSNLEDYLQQKLDHDGVKVASWLVTDARGLQLARVPSNRVNIGENFGWRTYFHGGPKERNPAWRPGPNDHVPQTQLSAMFQSTSSNLWVIGISTPIYRNQEFLGVLALTVEVGQFTDLRGSGQNREFAVLVDGRPSNTGVIVQHELFTRLLEQNRGEFSRRFREYRVPIHKMPATADHYRDPFAQDPLGSDYRGDWLAAKVPVTVRGEETGLFVIVQERYDQAIGAALSPLKAVAIDWVMLGVTATIVIVGGLWVYVLRSLNTAAPAETTPIDPKLALTPHPGDTVHFTTREEA
jgi:hypothetical protein